MEEGLKDIISLQAVCLQEVIQMLFGGVVRSYKKLRGIKLDRYLVSLFYESVKQFCIVVSSRAQCNYLQNQVQPPGL